MTPFRLVLANGQILFLQSLRKNLEEIPGLKIIGEACGAPELWEILKKNPPDMVLLEADNLQQIEMVREIKRIYPTVKILLIMAEKSKLLLQAILARADGYLLKENTYSELINAIEKIRQGGSYFCNIISGKMADMIHDGMSDKIKKRLTAKQIKVLTFRCESKSYREIAELLSVSPSTVRNYMTTIKRKLNLKTQSDLVIYAMRQGYIL
jgi:DNA-binding NarL/FixJ family response regulator